MSIENEDFKSWFEKMKSNSLWWMRMSEMYCRKNLNQVAASVHLYLLASPERLKSGDYADFRRLFQTFASKAEDAPMKLQLQQVEEKSEKGDNEWKPASPEHVDKCVKEFDEMMANSSMMNAFPRIGYKQSIEEGGWLPPKPAPYPSSSPREVYNKERHIAYLLANYDPVTKDRLPEWVDEETFNEAYDKKHEKKALKLAYKK